MRSDHPWKTVSSKVVYKNPWIQVREDVVVTPTGKDGLYGFMESNDSVMIVALNSKNEIYLVRTYSYPVKSWNWEIPGGGGDKEDGLVAAKRELEEETGILAKTWHKLGHTRICNGLMTERMTTYLALDTAPEGTKEVADEQIEEGRFFSLKAVDEMIQRGDINDGQSITAIHLTEKWLAKNRQ
jgi:8-oxo-dGTP pyrophosphatase MutT (NUDIX family)